MNQQRLLEKVLSRRKNHVPALSANIVHEFEEGPLIVDVPEQAPQAVEAFFQRFQLVDPESGARVILTLALDGISGGDAAPVILDVDAFTGANLNPTDLELWNILERLRELKNRSFFGTITELAAELYE